MLADGSPQKTAEESEIEILTVDKMRVEIAKLKQETANLKDANRWYTTSVRNVPLPSWLSTVVAIAVAFAGWYTGFFNALRERNEAQNERLKVESIDLERRKELLTTEIALKERDLEDVTRRLRPFEMEEAAIKDLRRLESDGLLVLFGVGREFDGIYIDIIRKGGSSIGVNGEIITSPPESNSSLDKALSALHQIRSLKGIRTNGLQLTDSQIADVLSRHELRSVEFDEGGITTEALRLMRLPQRLERLSLQANQISIVNLNRTSTLKYLALQQNPLTDDGIADLPLSFPNTEILNLRSTKVTNAALIHIVKLRKLSVIDVRETDISGSGLIELLECPRLNVLYADQDILTDSIKASLRDRSRHLHIISDGRTEDGGRW